MSTCVTCTFYNRRDDKGGYCRRFPPRIIFESFPNGSRAAQYFPYMESGEWCGEHKDTRTYHVEKSQ